YYINIGTTSGVSDIANLEDVCNETSYTPNNPLPSATTIYITIIPYNSSGNATGCTEESFMTETVVSIPNCTTITLNQNGADINITWDAVSNADDYLVTLGTTAGSNDVLESTVTGTSFQEQFTFTYGTTYYLNVIPRNTAGSAENCEASEVTFVIDAPLPNCTALTSPLNGSENISISTDLIWDTITNATGYKLQIGTSSNGNEILPLTDVGNITTYNPTANFPENTTVYVLIVPYNEQGDAIGCTEGYFITEVPNFIGKERYGISPNGDGINDFWELEGIENYVDNKVSVYNRWGDLVFQTEGYDNSLNVFYGTANRSTKMGADKLPEGTYFFKIEIPNIKPIKGFIVLKR
ncbi:MAG: gliding motility-associated C-terminal domain-containing protein, partial [Aestuariibaculum sp.]